MILLAGILIVLAYLLYATESALLANIGQEAGREAASPLLQDYRAIRASVATSIPLELTNATGKVRCPTDFTDYGGRIQTLVALLGRLESNRGMILDAHYRAASVSGGVLSTSIDLFLTNGLGSVSEVVSFQTACV